jgi:hypothetical protein
MKAVSCGLGVLAVAAHLVGLTAISDTWLRAYYWQSAGYAAIAPFVFSGPVLAGWAAFAAWRATKAQLDVTSVRNGAVVLGRWIAGPLAAVCAIWLATAVAVLVQARGVASVASVSPLAANLPITGVGIVAFGYVVGRALPIIAAVPLAVVAVYLAFVVPLSLSDFAPRHITGFHVNCCFIDTEPAAAGIAAPALFWGAVAVAGLVAAAYTHRNWIPVTVTIAAGAVMFAALTPLVAPLDVDASQPRSEQLLRCTGTAPRLCQWPEHETARPIMQTAVATVARSLTEIGATVPEEATEKYPAAWTVVADEGLTPQEALWSAAAGLVSEPLPVCARESGEWPMGQYQAVMIAWVAFRAGVSDDQVEALLPAEDIAEARRVLARQPAEQALWFNTNKAQLPDCAAQPVR